MKKDTRFTVLFLTQCVIGILLGYLIFEKGDEKPKQFGADFFRDVAGKLHAAGLTGQAAKQYELYLEKGKVDSSVRAKVSYSLGELYEHEGHLEKAVSWFYKVELLDPKSSYVTEANKKIVALLEKLKKFRAAQSFMSEKTSLDDKPVKGASIIARVGEQNIYDYQVNEYIDSLPANLKEKVKNPSVKKDILQKYVVDQLLWKKSKRLGLEKDPAFIKKLEQVTKQLLVDKLIKNEIESKISIQEDDLKNYFKANKDKFERKGGLKVSVLEYKGKKHSQKLLSLLRKKEIKEGIPGVKLKEQFITKGESFGGMDKNEIEKLFKKEVGEWSGPFLKSGVYKIFLIKEKIPSQSFPFEKIRSIVEQNYKMEKGQSLYKELVKESFETEKVQLFVERWK
ncbi:MAG: peptidylprolyl isomerase [Bdellovibrionota bacterium]|nr:peptidylprolyl isomerase [Bdellovibrionota bacterium]